MKRQLLIRDPFSELVDNFEKMFYGNERTGTMPVNISETEEAVSVSVMIPGVQREDIDVLFEKGTVTVSVKSPVQEADEKSTVIRREIPCGEFKRSLYLGNEVDGDSVKASYENGILTLYFAKREEAKPRQIPVS